MNVKQSMIQQLIENGCFNSDAELIYQESESELIDVLHTHSLNLGTDLTGYPPIITTLIFESVKPFAYKWLKENKPLAWNLEIFKN